MWGLLVLVLGAILLPTTSFGATSKSPIYRSPSQEGKVNNGVVVGGRGDILSSINSKIPPNAPGSFQASASSLSPYPPSPLRRVDSDVLDDEWGEDYYGHNNKDQYGSIRENYDEDPSSYLPEDTPQTKENEGGGFPSFFPEFPGFVGPGALDPVPPPPPQQIKGSIDYILIPLVLIGIAGPIFVVLYLILGAYEAKLSPITRSLDGAAASYKPYLDSLGWVVGRVVGEEEDCLDYAACRLGSFCASMGYHNYDKQLEKALDSFTPKVYKRKGRRLLRSMRQGQGGHCPLKKCFNLSP